MLSQLLNFVVNTLTIVAVIGLVLAVLSWRFRSWRPLFRLYIKTLKIIALGLCKLLWKPTFRRQGVGHIVEERRREEP